MKKVLLILLLVAMSVLFFRNSINEFPSHIHAWSQADRYALALGFLNNGFDFFHPQTFNLNVQFPASTPLAIEEGITAVDFPVHEYVIALLMKIIGSSQPWVFRLYNLLYSFIGLLFLFKLLNLVNYENTSVNFISIAFVFTAPVYTYYMAGFIPTITSLANCFIAYYFFFKYKKESNLRDFYYCVLFITLATLGRTSFAIFLIAMIGQQVLSYLKNRKIIRKEIAAYAIGVLVIASYFIYNTHLRKIYGSVFLSSVFPASGWIDFKEILKTVYQRWFFQYFTLSHYVFLVIGVVAIIFSLLKAKMISNLQRQIFMQLLIAGTGAVSFFILMAHQYKEHDYYFLDTFFPVAVLFLIAFASTVFFKINKYAGYLLIILFVSCFVFQSKHVQAKRFDTGSWDRYQATINNFTGADKFLDNNNVSADARILVIDAYAPNIPFILMNRKGYAVITTSKDEILKALKFRFDFVVIQNQFLLSDVLNNYPELKNCLSRIADNRKITLYKYQQVEKEQSMFEFLGLDNMKTLIDAPINFEDTIKSVYWINAEQKSSKLNCGLAKENFNNQSAYVDAVTEYGATFYLPASNIDMSISHTILFEGDFCSQDDLNEVFISGYAGHDDMISYQNYFDLSTQIKEKDKFISVQFLFNFNKLDSLDEIKIFVWNPKKKLVAYDNLRVRVY